jgi:hypothetical protein
VLSWFRSRTIVLVCVLMLVALAVRPFPPAERAAAVLFAPARWIAELARPLSWMQVRAVRASQSAAEEALLAESEASRALLAAQIEAALPTDPALREGRGFLVAEVLERFKDRDLLRVRFPVGAGVVPDMPVVCRDTYLGRVRDVDATRPGEGIVQLVTDESLRVGAEVVDGATEPVPIVVGGIVGARQRTEGVLLLGARHEKSPVRAGLVRVRETGPGERAGRRAHADGFALGTLRELWKKGRPMPVVATGFDYEFGLSQVVIAGGPELATAGPLLADDAFDEARWCTGRVRIAGDSTPGRRTRRLSLPAGARVESGAALALGARFLGRVIHVDGREAIAALLGDRALEFSGVAAVAGHDVPLHMGRLKSLGVDSDGAIVLGWGAPEQGAGAPPRPSGPARIATSSGDRGVPAGLWVGTCALPARAGFHELRLVPVQDPADLLRVRVRLAPAESAADTREERP